MSEMNGYEELVKPIDHYANMIDDMAKEQAKIYDNFIGEKLSKLGFTLDYLKNQGCYRLVKTIDECTEEHYFHVNGICVLGIRQTTSLESEGNVYTHNVTLEVIGMADAEEKAI